MKKILVVGGAGYIGAHMVQSLSESGYHVITLDNLTTGHRSAVLSGDFIEGHSGDSNTLDRLFRSHDIHAVMHFAAHSQVEQSISDPAMYYENNVSNTLKLLAAMRKADVKHFVFSSSAAVYGEPLQLPINESHSCRPVNPYGKSKWFVEQILADYERAYGLKYVALRYFNAAGADPSCKIGELHDPETHLIPIVLQVAAGDRTHLNIYGTDYETRDGSCIRDYVHVTDLCRAHIQALNYIVSGGDVRAFNLGTGTGASILEVVQAVEQVTRKHINCVKASRRPGDPAILIADSRAARDQLDWRPQFENIQLIIQHAWAWHQKVAMSRSLDRRTIAIA